MRDPPRPCSSVHKPQVPLCAVGVQHRAAFDPGECSSPSLIESKSDAERQTVEGSNTVTRGLHKGGVSFEPSATFWLTLRAAAPRLAGDDDLRHRRQTSAAPQLHQVDDT